MATHLEQQKTNDGSLIFGEIRSSRYVLPTDAANLSDEEKESLQIYTEQVIKNEVLKEFYEDIDEIDKTATDRISHDLAESILSIFPLGSTDELDRVSFFIIYSIPIFIEAILEEEPDVLLEKNAETLKKRVEEFINDNKNFKIMTEEEFKKTQELQPVTATSPKK